MKERFIFFEANGAEIPKQFKRTHAEELTIKRWDDLKAQEFFISRGHYQLLVGVVADVEYDVVTSVPPSNTYSFKVLYREDIRTLDDAAAFLQT